MIIKVWGARGSIPVSGKEYVRYGGDTPCVEVRSSSGEVLILDSGTGIRRLGKSLIKEGIRSCTLMFTHAHWDHIMGFPFFLPVYHKGFNINITGCDFAQHAIQDLVSKTMQAPNFPVKFEDVAAKITFHQHMECRAQYGAFYVEDIPISHPNGGVGYKITEGGKTFVFLTDNELGYKHPGGMEFRDYVKFCSGADMLMHDSEFTQEEYEKHVTWGHSSRDDAARLALESGVKRFGLFHHNQDRADDDVDAMVEYCRRLLPAGMDVSAMGTGTEIKF